MDKGAMKKLTLTTYLAIRDIPVSELFLLLGHMSDASGAVVLMNIGSHESFELMEMLSPKKRDRVVQCLIDLANAEEKLLQQVMSKVEKEITAVLAKQYGTIDIQSRLAEMVCRFSSSGRTAVLDLIRDKKKTFYNQIHKNIMQYKEENNVYFFEDILSFPDEDLRDRIQEIDTRKIAVAIKEADETIRAKILENMSKRVQEMVMDDLQYIESVTVEEIDEAQSYVIAALMRNKRRA